VRPDADQHAGEEPAEEEGAGDAEDAADSDEAGGLRDDEADKSAARCTEGEADAHLLRALRDGVGKDAVDADGGEDDREQGEAAMSSMMRRRCATWLETRWSMVWMSKSGCCGSTARTALRMAFASRAGSVVLRRAILSVSDGD
jgi:hypothetical protein